jgi:hypothetical protein
MMTKQQDEVVQDRCPDIMQAISGYTVDVQTEINLDMVMQDDVEVEVRVNSEGPVIRDDLKMGLSEGRP